MIFFLIKHYKLVSFHAMKSMTYCIINRETFLKLNEIVSLNLKLYLTRTLELLDRRPSCIGGALS